MGDRINLKIIEEAFQNWDKKPMDTAWLQRAEKHVKKLLEKNINQVQLCSYLGSIYLKEEKFSRAKKEYEKCIELTKNQKRKEEFTLNVILAIMHIVNQKVNNRNKEYESDCYEAINLLQNLRKMTGHYNYHTLQLVDFFYSKIIEKGINPEKMEKTLVDLCYLLDLPEISLNFDLQFKILNSMKYYDFESCWVHIVKHSWDYRHNLNWNQFVRDYLDSFETTFWNEIYDKAQNRELLKLEVWAEYVFALDNITRIYLENGEDAKEELAKLKDVISNQIPSSEDKLINENSYAVKQEYMTRYVKHSTIKVEKIMRECKESSEIWYSTIKESITYWKLCFAYQDSEIMNELKTLDEKTIKASYKESPLDDITRKIKETKLNNHGILGLSSTSSLSLTSLSSLNSVDSLRITAVNLEDREKISFQQSLGICERLSDSFYHLISYALCYNLEWLKQPPIESPDKENRKFTEEEVILSSNSENIPIIIDEQETRIFLFKDSHLDLIYNKFNQNDELDDFQFPLENYFNTDIYMIHDPWDLNKILNICMWHMYDGSFHKYLRYLFPTIPEYLNLSYLNNQNIVTLEDITCFFLLLIIQRHIKCSHNKKFFKSNASVGQTFFLSVIQHPSVSVSTKITKFWYSLIATYGREKYKYMVTDIYSPEDIYKVILEIRGEYNSYHKDIIKYIWGLLGLHLMDVFMETENVDHSVEALHYMSLYLNATKNDTNRNKSPSSSSSNKQIDPSSVMFEEIYDASELCGRDFYSFILRKYKALKEKKCTRYESLIKNNKSLLSAYIDDFDFLSDLEVGQGLMMTATSPLALPLNEYTIGEDGGEGTETLIKSNLSSTISPTPSSPIPNSSSATTVKNLDEAIRQGTLNGNNRLSRQLKLLKTMKEKQDLKELEPRGIPLALYKLDLVNNSGSSNINTSTIPIFNSYDDNIINITPPSPSKSKKKGKSRFSEYNSVDDDDDDNDDDNDNDLSSQNNAFGSMRDSSGYIDDIMDSSGSEFSEEEDEEDIIEKLSRKQKQIEKQQQQQQQQQQKRLSNANANASLSNAIFTFKSMNTNTNQYPTSKSNSTDTLSSTNSRLSRQLEKLNSFKKQ